MVIAPREISNRPDSPLKQEAIDMDMLPIGIANTRFDTTAVRSGSTDALLQSAPQSSFAQARHYLAKVLPWPQEGDEPAYS